MFSWHFYRLTILSILLAFTYGGIKPIRHYGLCYVNGEIGQCQHRHNCWEEETHFDSLSRTNCANSIRTDLVCCRRQQAENALSTLKFTLPKPGVCGNFPDIIEDRIMAGTQAHIKDFPWMALLRYSTDGVEYSHLCGGSLIHESWVLTAAHCVPNQDRSQKLLQIRLGEWNTTSSPDCEQLMDERICVPPHIDISIDRIIVHEQYAPNGTPNTNNTHDIALLRLKHPVSFTELVIPICLPVANANDEYAYAGYAMDVAGWGNTEQIRSGGSPIKMKAILNVLSMANCKEIYPQAVPGQLCAGGATDASTCHGDSGGPLMLLDSNGLGNRSYYLAGIVSLGSVSCNNHGRPMIFTRVEYYMPWLLGTLNANT